MKQLKKVICLVFACLAVLAGKAQVIVDNNWSNQFIEEKCLILPMKTESDFPDEEIVRGQFDGSFKPFDSRFVMGQESMNWLKINVENKTAKAQTLFIGTTRFEYMTFWVKTDTSVQGPFVNGQKIPTQEKSVKINGLSFFKFYVGKDKKVTLYLKAINKDAPTTPQQMVPLIVANEIYFHDNYEQVGNLTFLFLGAMSIMFIFNLLLFATTHLKTYFYYSVYVLGQIFFGMGLIPQFAYPLYGHMDVNQAPLSNIGSIISIFYILVAQGILETKKYFPMVHAFLNFLIALLLVGFVTSIVALTGISVWCNYFAAFSAFPTVFVTSFLMLLKKHVPGTFFFIAMIVYFIGLMLFLFSLINVIPSVVFGISILTILQICIAGEVALFSLGIGVKINEMQDVKNKEEIERLKSEQLLAENEEISRQRQKAEKALADLKVTQNQLIQKEKLASLGELTAGIAHEIQNPLNFVNNFSELSVGIAQDLKEELHKTEPDAAYVEELLADLTQNQEKINYHGKRASSIVRGMLEHSHMSTGERVLTDVNTLCEEYLRLAYHGMRAKDKSFNANFKTDLDPNLPKIKAIPQDIGRVLLNLINNAFYAVNAATSPTQNQPIVIVSTKNMGNQVVITVKDNGHGIPAAIRAKIFQPFFTTKPTGEGTGLGLSLSYDIITKGHGGTLDVVSTEGVGTEFTISLPIS